MTRGSVPQRRTRAYVAIGVLVLSLGLSPHVAAHASNNDLIDPDNAGHYVDRNNLTASGNSATGRGIAELDRTKMNATVSGSGGVEVFDSTYGDSCSWYNVRGRATCVDKTLGGFTSSGTLRASATAALPTIRTTTRA